MTPDRPLRVLVSPDADDRFMVWAIAQGLIDTDGLTFQLDHAPTDALNAAGADEEPPDVLAISVAAYAGLSDRYQLLPHGGSLGEGYGPVVVAREGTTLDALAGRKVAVPGLTTTAWTVLRMLVDVEPVEIPITPYARIFGALRDGEVDAALIIHEGRLTFEDEGFVAVAELGVWWQQVTNLPLPLGANAVRRDLGPELINRVSAVLRRSIAYALEHREAAMDALLAGGSVLDRPRLDRYLQMYANHRTLDYGADGRAAVEVLLEQGAALGVLAECEVDWAP